MVGELARTGIWASTRTHGSQNMPQRLFARVKDPCRLGLMLGHRHTEKDTWDTDRAHALTGAQKIQN